jgi:hypothetical protein
VELTEKVAGNVAFLWEEDESEGIVIDVATVTLGDFNGFSITGGIYYIGFGGFSSYCAGSSNSFFVSDPLTLELGETQQSGVDASYAFDEYFEIGGGAFNGDIDEKDDDDHIDGFYGYLNIFPVEGISLGGSIISDMADTDAEITLMDITVLNEETGEEEEIEKDWLEGSSPLGYAFFLSVEKGPLGFEAEFIGSDDFDEEDLDMNGDGDGDSPAAWNFELAALLLDEKLTIAGKYAGTDEWYDMPETQIGGVVAYEIFDNTTLAVEYQHNDFDEEWSENDNEQIATAQLAIEY